MSYYEITSSIARLSDTITMLFNNAFPDDFAEAAKQKQYTVHRFCGLKVIRVYYNYNDPDSSAVITLNGINIDATPVSNDEFLRYKNPIKEIMKFYKCNTLYIEFDLGKPNRVLFDSDGILLAPNELTSKFTEEIAHPIHVNDIDSLFYQNNPENMAEFLVDCLRLDPCVGPYMPYKEKIDE